MIIEWWRQWLQDARAVVELIILFFDSADFLVLFLLALVFSTVGRRFCRVEYICIAQQYSGAVMVAYFVYRYMHAGSEQELLFSALRALLVAWLSYGVLLFVVPLVVGIRCVVRDTYWRARRWAATAWQWCQVAWKWWKDWRWRRRKLEDQEPYRPPTYAERLSESVEQIREQFEAEQSVLDVMSTGLEDDEEQEFRDLPRQKMLKRLYDALGGDEPE